VGILSTLENLAPDRASAWIDGLSADETRGWLAELYDWEEAFARPAQCEPPGDWRIWLINAGRGFGKTRSGAEWVRKLVESGRSRRMALVGRTSADVRDVMIEGESGLLQICPPDFFPLWQPSKRKLVWPRESPSGISRISVGPVPAEAHTYTADEPDLLRGPQHDAAWCDELAAWRFSATWDNLMLGLRIGDDPRCCVTTTPKPVRLIRELMERSSTIVTGGSTYDNLANLAPAFVDEIIQQYEGTALGEQELHAKLLTEAEGALWKRGWIEANRVTEHPDLDLLVVGVDPAMTSHEDSNETGIVAAGMAWIEGVDHYYVLGDVSGRLTPDRWANGAIDLLEEYEGDWIVGEVNNGGDLVEYTIRTVDPNVPFRQVRASRGKRVRADPVAAIYAQGRGHHVGVFRDLEDQLCNWEPGKNQESPDRLDGLVWAISQMMPKKKRPPKNLDLSGMLGKDSYWRGEEAL
jgi:phage terminase large subunit-like protein